MSYFNISHLARALGDMNFQVSLEHLFLFLSCRKFKLVVICKFILGCNKSPEVWRKTHELWIMVFFLFCDIPWLISVLYVRGKHTNWHPYSLYVKVYNSGCTVSRHAPFSPLKHTIIFFKFTETPLENILSLNLECRRLNEYGTICVLCCF